AGSVPMQIPKLICTIVALVAVSSASGANAADREQLKAAAAKSVALLQKTGPEFFRKSGCVSCHHQTVTALAVSEARRHGIAVDDKPAREQLQITALTMRAFRTRQLQRADHPLNSAPSTGYLLLGMAVENYPADETTDASIIEMAGRQT